MLFPYSEPLSIRRNAQQLDEHFLENPWYQNYDELTNLFRKLESEHPQIAKLYSIGKSVRNRDLWALEINGNVGNRSLLTPMFKYVANMHGDESVGRQLMIYLAQYLILNYGKDERVTRIVNNTDVFLMPSMNPDGYENSQVGVGTGFSLFIPAVIITVIVLVADKGLGQVFRKTFCGNGIQILCFAKKFKNSP